MANSLDKDLSGQIVLLTNGTIVRCVSGFGMVPFTVGTALFVEDKDGKSRRVSGYDVVKLATEDDCKVFLAGWLPFEKDKS